MFWNATIFWRLIEMHAPVFFLILARFMQFLYFQDSYVFSSYVKLNTLSFNTTKYHDSNPNLPQSSMTCAKFSTITKDKPYQLGVFSGFASPPNIWLLLYLLARIGHSMCFLVNFWFWPIFTKLCPLIELNGNWTFFLPTHKHPFILDLSVFICLFTAFLKPS